MDGYDAFSAGVEPGGLRNRNEIKVLIAFLLKNTERGLSRRQLMEVIQREGLANYFEASQAYLYPHFTQFLNELIRAMTTSC